MGIKADGDLFGLPPALRTPLLAGVKKKTAQVLLGLHRLDKKIRNHKIVVNPVEADLPTSKVAQAALACIRFTLDKATDFLTYRHNDADEMQGIARVYSPLNIWLDKQSAKGYQIAGLFKDIITDNVPTPFLKSLFEVLDADDSKAYKKQLADWINPVITDQVIRALTPLLEKEQAGQAAFDQSLLIALLPIFTRHLKLFNQGSHKAGGLNFANYAEAAKGKLHPAVPVGGDQDAQDLQRQTGFYQNQVDLIFQLIFPKGKEDLAKLLPELDLTPDQLEPVWTAAKDGIASQLPTALDSLFDEEVFLEVFKNLFEMTIETLDQPIEIQSAKPKHLSKEEQEREAKVDRLVGELVLEAARFIDLPVDRLNKMPGWLKKMIDLKGLKQSSVESIGATIREKFNGEMLSQSVQKALETLATQEHVKMTADQKSEYKAQSYAQIKKLEHKIAEKGISYTFRYLGARIAHATDIFTNPVLKGIRYAVLTVCSFVLVRLVAGILRLFKIESFVVNRLYDLMQHAREKAFPILIQPKLHEDLVYRGVEAFERVLTHKPAKKKKVVNP